MSETPAITFKEGEEVSRCEVIDQNSKMIKVKHYFQSEKGEWYEVVIAFPKNKIKKM